MSPEYTLNFQCRYKTGYPDIHLVRRKNVIRIIIFGDEMAMDENGSKYLSSKTDPTGIRNFNQINIQNDIFVLEKTIDG